MTRLSFDKKKVHYNLIFEVGKRRVRSVTLRDL